MQHNIEQYSTNSFNISKYCKIFTNINQNYMILLRHVLKEQENFHNSKISINVVKFELFMVRYGLAMSNIVRYA